MHSAESVPHRKLEIHPQHLALMAAAKLQQLCKINQKVGGLQQNDRAYTGAAIN